MPFTRKVKFPLTNHIDVTGIGHSNLFESEYSRVGLAGQMNLYDHFDDGSYVSYTTRSGNGWSGTIAESGTLITMQTGTAGDYEWAQLYKNIPGNNENLRVRAKVSVLPQAAGVAIRCQESGGDGTYVAGFAASGKFAIYKGTYGNLASTTVGYSLNTYYWLEISFNTISNMITASFYNDSGTLLESITAVDSAFTGINKGLQLVRNGTIGQPTLTVDWLENSNFLTTSPSPATPWTALQAGDVIDMSTAKAWMYKDGVVQAAGNTDVTFKYAANGGSDSTAKTLTQLRAETDVTVTNETNSFKIYGLYASDGQYKSESETWIEFNVVSAGGGGISKARLINTGGF